MNTQITSPLVRDDGQTNIRLMSRQPKNKTRSIESASRKVEIELSSPEAKRLYRDQFETLQRSVHYVKVFARLLNLDEAMVDEAEQSLDTQLSNQLTLVDQYLATANRRCAEKDIRELATYDVQPMKLVVPVVSTFDNRFLDLLAKVDQLMPMLETLAIDGHLSSKELAIRKAIAKRAVKRTASLARNIKGKLQNKARALADPGRPGELGRTPKARSPAADRIPGMADQNDATPEVSTIPGAGSSAPVLRGPKDLRDDTGADANDLVAHRQLVNNAVRHDGGPGVPSRGDAPGDVPERQPESRVEVG